MKLYLPLTLLLNQLFITLGSAEVREAKTATLDKDVPPCEHETLSEA